MLWIDVARRLLSGTVPRPFDPRAHLSGGGSTQVIGKQREAPAKIAGAEAI